LRVLPGVVPVDGSDREDWSAEDKFQVVAEALVLALALAFAELGEYCRRRELFAEHISRWGEACLSVTA
jgi:hypothetical protein